MPDQLTAWLCRLRHSLWYLIAVPRCCGCGQYLPPSRTVLCDECRLRYEMVRGQRCAICERPIDQCRCTPHVLERAGIRTLLKLHRYDVGGSEAAEDQMLYVLKRRNHAGLERFYAAELAQNIRALLAEQPGNWVIVPVPRTHRARATYGYDHVERLASRVSRMLDVPYLPVLHRRHFGREQKYLSAEERRRNVEGAFFCKRGTDLRGRRVLLLDDVVTTGATLAACTKPLHLAGARRICAAVIAIAYRNSAYRPAPDACLFPPADG